jgi:hypothetical protein
MRKGKPLGQGGADIAHRIEGSCASVVNPMPELRHAHADFGLRHTCLGKRRGKLAPGGARKRSPAAMSLIIKLCKRFGERGHDWGALLAWRPGFLHDFSGKYKHLLS